jgi:hypothetical protein
MPPGQISFPFESPSEFNFLNGNTDAEVRHLLMSAVNAAEYDRSNSLGGGSAKAWLGSLNGAAIHYEMPGFLSFW